MASSSLISLGPAAAPAAAGATTDTDRRRMAERMVEVFDDIHKIHPFSKHEIPSALLVRSPVDEKTEEERTRRTSKDTWLRDHYYFNSDEGKHALQLNYTVLEDVRRVFNQREALKSMEMEQDQRLSKQHLGTVFTELLQKSTQKIIAEATLNEQLERIAKNSMTAVFHEIERQHVTSNVTKETEKERARRTSKDTWLRDHYYFCSPEGQKALSAHNDVLTDVRRVYNIKEVMGAMDEEQARRTNKAVLTGVLEDMLRQFSVQRVIDATFTEQVQRVGRNNMTYILDQLRYNARARDITQAVEVERERQMAEAEATRFVRYNGCVCQPFLPEIRLSRKRSFVEVA